MITFRKYGQFLEDLASHNIHSRRVDGLSRHKTGSRLLCIKHDVEAALPLALKMARLEAERGHAATYYFQGDLLQADQAADIIREIDELGHEVAYHYDVLDACDGNYDAALSEFDRYKTLVENLSGHSLQSVCPHGNPTKIRNGWRSNKDFFRAAEIRARYPGIIDIVVDFDTLLPGGVYLSDAGFSLRRIGNIGGNDLSNETAISDGTAIDWPDVTRLVESSEGVVLSLHSHRLRESDIWITLMRARMRILRSGYKVAKKIPMVKALTSRFYAIARKL